MIEAIISIDNDTKKKNERSVGAHFVKPEFPYLENYIFVVYVYVYIHECLRLT